MGIGADAAEQLVIIPQQQPGFGLVVDVQIDLGLIAMVAGDHRQWGTFGRASALAGQPHLTPA